MRLKNILLFLFLILLSQTLLSQRIGQITNITHNRLAVDHDEYLGDILLYENRLFVTTVGKVEELLIREDGSLQGISSFPTGVHPRALMDGMNLHVLYHANERTYVMVFDISTSPMRHVDTVPLALIPFRYAQVLGDYLLLSRHLQPAAKYCRETLEFLGNFDGLIGDFVVHGSIIINLIVQLDEDSPIYSIRFHDYDTATEEEPIGMKLFELPLDVPILPSINIRDNYLYVNSRENIAVYDISYIDDVQKVLSISSHENESYTTAIIYRDYLIAYHSEGIHVYDISDKDNITLHRDKRMPLHAPGRPSMVISEDRLFANVRTDVRTYDLTNDFEVIARYGNRAGNIRFLDGYVIENSDISSEVRIFSILEDDSNIIVIDTELEPETSVVQSFGFWDDYVLLAIAADDAGYFDIYDLNTFARIDRIPLSYRPARLILLEEHIIITGMENRVYTLNDYSLSFLGNIPGSFAGDLYYTHLDFLIFLTDQTIEFRAKSNPLEILSYHPRLHGINSGFRQLGEYAVIYRTADGIYRIYTFDEDLSGFTHAFIVAGIGPFLSVHRNFMTINNGIFDTPNEYFVIENGIHRKIGEFRVHKEVLETFIFPEHRKLIKRTSSGFYVYDIEFTDVSDADIVVAVEDRRVNVFPNPVRNSEVSFKVASQSKAGNDELEISIFNVRGQRVKRSKDFSVKNGESVFTWNRRNEKGQEVASGVYFYRITAGNDVQTGRFLIIR